MPQTNVVIEIHPVLLFTLNNTKNIAYHITEELIFYADKIMVMGSSKNSSEIWQFYSNRKNLMLAKYRPTCFTVSTFGRHFLAYVQNAWMYFNETYHS